MTDLKSNKKRKGHPQEINPAGEVCIPVYVPDDIEWIAAFFGAIRKLSNRSTWDYDDAGQYITIADRWATVADGARNAYAGQISCSDLEAPAEDEGCVEIGAFHPAVTYYPNHPIISPNYVAPFSDVPVWVTGSGYGPLANSSDAIFNPLAVFNFVDPITFFESGPRIDLNFSGAGEIDITFLQMPLGGYAIVYPDGNPLLADFIDLSWVEIDSETGPEALIALIELLQGDQVNEYIHTINFETSGPHTLTIHIVPVQDQPPYAGFGGGLRGFDLCGEIDLTSEVVMPYTLEASPDGSIVLRQNGATVSTVDLKALLDDDYVNVEGDTMSGPLNIYPTSSTVMRLGGASQGGVITVNQSSWFLSVISNGAGIIHQLAASNSYTFLTTAQGWRWFPSNSLRAQIDALGRMIATDALYANKLSSTNAWRNAIDMVAGWIDSTDATRLSSLSLGVYNWANRQEIMQAWATDGTEAPYLAFRGEIPVAMPLLTGSTLETALGDVVAALVTQGLLDGDLEITEPEDLPPDIPDSDGDVPELDSLRRCRAVTYVLSIVTAFVDYVIDNLADVTGPELISGMLDELNIPVDQAIQVAAYFQLLFTTIGQGGLDGLKSDLADALNDLTSAAYSEGGTLSKSQVLAAIYNALDHPSQDDIYAALDIVISSITFQQWEALYARGVVVPTGFICEEFPVAPCEAFVDYRFDAAWDTEYDGTLVPGFGLQSVNHQPADLNYAVSYLQFQGCGSTRFTIDWWSSDSAYDNVIWGLQTWNSGTQQWDGGVTTPLNGAGVGDNTGTVEIGTGMGDTHRFVVQTQAGPPPHNSFIVRIQWEEYAP